MSTINISEALQKELNVLSPSYYPEVLGFIESLRTNRLLAVPATMLLSESALSKDWDNEEEDKAWASL